MIFDARAAEEKIGYSFKDKKLLNECFTHSSYAYENGETSNERLEFLGDAVLELVVTEYLYKRFDEAEGKLTDKRRSLVSKEPLLALVLEKGLNELVLLGNGLKKLAKTDEKLFSSLYEAIVGGIYIDGGYEPAKEFIERTLIRAWESAEERDAGGRIADKKTAGAKGAKAAFFPKEIPADSKTRLQEFVQKEKLGKISYGLKEKTGPDHDPYFKVFVTIDGKIFAEGEGKSKKAAESRAAATLLEALEKEEGRKA